MPAESARSRAAVPEAVSRGLASSSCLRYSGSVAGGATAVTEAILKRDDWGGSKGFVAKLN